MDTADVSLKSHNTSFQLLLNLQNIIFKKVFDIIQLFCFRDPNDLNSTQKVYFSLDKQNVNLNAEEERKTSNLENAIQHTKKSKSHCMM
jgi:hypothetical protein